MPSELYQRFKYLHIFTYHRSIVDGKILQQHQTFRTFWWDIALPDVVFACLSDMEPRCLEYRTTWNPE